MPSPNFKAPLWLVLNSASGGNGDAANASVIAGLTEAGMTPARTFDCATGDLPTRAALVAEGVGIVVCHTGDGTVGALLTALEGWSGAVLVLPGGTTNLLARSLHAERAADEIAAGLAAMRRIRRQCIRMGDGTAVSEVLAGPGARWSEVREGLREGDVAEVAGKTLEAVRESTGGAAVVLAEPPIGKRGGYAGVRLTPGADGIEVQGFGAETLGEYLQQGLALLRRDFREGPHDNLGTHRALVCRSLDRGAIELMIDGEHCQGAPILRFSLAELDLDLLALPR